MIAHMRVILSAEFDRRHFSLHAAFQQGGGMGVHRQINALTHFAEDFSAHLLRCIHKRRVLASQKVIHTCCG
jgi:hypothetical protein